jgi:hypothetical protein
LEVDFMGRGSLGWPLILALAGPAALWAVLFAALPPSCQDFPLNDDWAYSKGAFAFATGEGIHYYRQGSMPLLGQWLWAYPFVKLLGESHAALRLSTILLGCLGLAAFYDLLRRDASLAPPQAAFGAATLAVNPLYFLLCGTFMSDVPAFALSLMALALYGRALTGGGLTWLAAAAVVATLAAVTRQNTVTVGVAVGVLVWRNRGLRWHPAWILAVLAPLAAGLITNSWFSARPDAVPLGPRIPALGQTGLRAFVLAHYLGLAALPVLALRPTVGSPKVFLAALAVMLGGAAWCLVFGEDIFPWHAYHGGLFPYIENLVTPWGTLESGNYVVGQRPLMMGRATQAVVTAAGCLGAALLLGRLAARLRAGPSLGLLGAFTAAHLLLLLVSPTLYDRYLIVLMPGAFALALSGEEARSCWPGGLAVLGVFAVISLGLMHDWLSWNAARWELGRRAVARGIAVEDIEGGLEWDSWHAPVSVAPDPEATQPPPRGLMLLFNRRRFPHLTGRYALAFSRPPDTVQLDAQTYRLWLVPRERQFLLVEEVKARNGPAE